MLNDAVHGNKKHIFKNFIPAHFLPQIVQILKLVEITFELALVAYLIISRYLFQIRLYYFYYHPIAHFNFFHPAFIPYLFSVHSEILTNLFAQFVEISVSFVFHNASSPPKVIKKVHFIYIFSLPYQ